MWIKIVAFQLRIGFLCYNSYNWNILLSTINNKTKEKDVDKKNCMDGGGMLHHLYVSGR